MMCQRAENLVSAVLKRGESEYERKTFVDGIFEQMHQIKQAPLNFVHRKLVQFAVKESQQKISILWFVAKAMSQRPKNDDTKKKTAIDVQQIDDMDVISILSGTWFVL